MVASMTENPWLWYWSTDQETYRLIGSGTRDEVLKEARQEVADLDDGSEMFSIMEATKAVPIAPTAEGVIDLFIDSNDEIWSEDGPDLPSERNAEWIKAKAELSDVLADWFERYEKLLPTPWAFKSTRSYEEVALAQEVAA